MSFEGVSVVVTGSGQGLGRAIALDLATRGATVLGCERQGARATEVHGGGTIHTFACDIRDRAQVAAFATDAKGVTGRIDHWINNAGLALSGTTLAAQDPEDFDRMIAINLVGTMNACRSAMALMEEQGSGTIWNMLGAGWDGNPVPGMGGYATSKVALTFLTRSLAAESEDKPYRIAGLSPGLVMTEGFFREHARHRPADLAAREAVVNLIGDHPETIAEWIAGQLANEVANGAILAWLTGERIAERKAMDPPRDILSAYPKVRS